MSEKTLKELAEYVGGEIYNGSGEIKISSVSTLSKAVAGQISFLTNDKYAGYLNDTKASAVIVGEKIDCPVPLLIAKDPYYAMTQIMILLHGFRPHEKIGISPQAKISPDAAVGDGCDIHPFAVICSGAKIGRQCKIYPGVYIGRDVHIGDDCVLYPNVVIHDKCILGNRVVINSSTTVGEDGFGYATHKGIHHKIPQIGTVIIEDDVEIGSNCGIQRGAIDDTIIGKGTKMGDLCDIGHGTKIGPYCLIIGQAAFAGSATIGHHCVIAGQVGIIGHCKIGNCVQIGAQAGVAGDVPDNAKIAGSPAIEANKAKRAYLLIEHLPAIRQTLRHITRQFKKLDMPVKDDHDDDNGGK